MSHTRDPNVLLIYVDQMRFDAMGCAGNAEVLTPHLDRLAGRGVRFSHCFVQNPVCMPSRFSMLSGRYPSSLGVTHMGVPVSEDAEVLPRMLGRFGLRTAQIGKLHFLPHANRDHRQAHPAYGFDHAEISDEPGVYPDAYRAWVQRHFPEELPHISQVAHPPALREWQRIMQVNDGIDRIEDFDAYVTRAYPGREEATYTSWVTQRTKAYLDARAADGNAFFCISGFYNPHPPLVAPQRFLDLYREADLTPTTFPPALEARRQARGLTDDHLRQAKRGYYAMISELDDAVGRLLDHLDATGLADHTLVVFTSDHGEFLGEQMAWGKGYPAPDAVSRVPLLIAGPGVEPGDRGGVVMDGIVEAVDLVPTILEALGRPIPPQVEGTSRWGHLRGGAAVADKGEAAALTETAKWKCLRSVEHRYFLHHDGREELYALAEPFGEYRDLADRPEQAPTLATMRHRLLAKLLNKERPLPRQWTY